MDFQAEHSHDQKGLFTQPTKEVFEVAIDLEAGQCGARGILWSDAVFGPRSVKQRRS